MSAVFIMAQACVTALGASLDAMWPRLCAGESAIAPINRFETSHLDFHAAACLPNLEAGEHPNRTCALMARCLPGTVPSATASNNWSVPSATTSNNWERGRPRPQMPPPSNIAIPFAHAAASPLVIPPSTFVIWAGVKGDAEWVEQRLSGQQAPPEGGTPERASSAAFFSAAHYRYWVAKRLGLRGAGLEVNAACASSAAALALGAMMIERGEADSVLVCAADIVSRFSFMGFAALRGLSSTTCRPLDQTRDGLCLGDGAAAILLMSERLASESQLAPLARLAGWGISNDATHLTAPARDGCGLSAAIRAALQTAQTPPEAIDAFCVHGTATVYNDAMELTALEAVFGERRFPIFSIKGAVGHTLGAAGALEAAVCARALRERCVPATAGLAAPEARAQGRAANAPQAFAARNILTTNSGFGGVNAALVLCRP